MKNWLRIALACLVALCIMLTPVMGRADVGDFSGDYEFDTDWGSSDWGDSDWSSSDWDDDDDDWDSDDTVVMGGGGLFGGGCGFR